MAVSLLATSSIQTPFFSLSLSLSFFLDMEAAIKTVVTTFLSSSKGKENLDSKGFQKMVSKQLGGIMEVKNCKNFHCSPIVLHK